MKQPPPAPKLTPTMPPCPPYEIGLGLSTVDGWIVFAAVMFCVAGVNVIAFMLR